MTGIRPQDNELLRPDVTEFGNILSAIQIRGALEALAGKSRTYILFKDKKGKTFPIPKIRFEWHELMIVVDVTFVNLGGWTFELIGATVHQDGKQIGDPLNSKMQDLMRQALKALKHKMESGGAMSNADF